MKVFILRKTQCQKSLFIKNVIIQLILRKLALQGYTNIKGIQNPLFGQKVKNLPTPLSEPADHFHFENFQFKYTALGSGKPNIHFLRKYVPPTE